MAANRTYLLVPVCERHHNVERGQKETEVEEGVAVGHSIFLIVHSPSDSVLPRGGLFAGGQTLTFLSLHQSVHLSIVGRADAVMGNSMKNSLFTDSSKFQQLLIVDADELVLNWFPL